MVIGQEVEFDEPGNLCFGCSPHNEHGLQVRFTHSGPGAVEGRYVAAEHTCGAPGVVHGGLQAVLLDEAIGYAIAAHVGAFDDPGPEFPSIVTVDFDLRYRRPVLVGAELVLRARVDRVEGRDYFATGQILDGEDGLLTGATARWKRLAV